MWGVGKEGGQVSCLGDISHLRGVKGRKIKLVERISYFRFMGSKSKRGMEGGGEVNNLGWQAAPGT